MRVRARALFRSAERLLDVLLNFLQSILIQLGQYPLPFLLRFLHMASYWARTLADILPMNRVLYHPTMFELA